MNRGERIKIAGELQKKGKNISIGLDFSLAGYYFKQIGICEGEFISKISTAREGVVSRMLSNLALFSRNHFA